MANMVEFFFNTEAKILALTSDSEQWIDRAFYYIDGVSYFYQLVNGAMEKKATGSELEGVGIKLNNKVIGGVKNKIEHSDVLDIPENYEYNLLNLQVHGIITCKGTINILS